MKKIIIYIIFNVSCQIITISDFHYYYIIFYSKCGNYKNLKFQQCWQLTSYEHVYFVCFSCRVVVPFWASLQYFVHLYFAIYLSWYWHRKCVLRGNIGTGFLRGNVCCLSPILPNTLFIFIFPIEVAKNKILFIENN